MKIVLLRTISLFFLFPCFLSAGDSNPQPTYAMVFHEVYCKKYNNAIQHYMYSLKKRGYPAFHFCTDTVDIKELKKRINLNAEKRKVSLSEIKGINLFGPVTSTEIIDYLKPHGFSFNPTATLMADNIELVLSRNTVIDIKTEEYSSPDIKRWVSHMFASPDELNINISKTLYNFSENLARQESNSAGEHIKDHLQKRLSYSRTIDYFNFPYGEGTAILGMASFPVLWVVTGLSRLYSGYSFWRRWQTDGDYYGSPVLILGMLALEGLAITSYLYNQPYLPDDNQWKKVLLIKALIVDGLLDLPAIQ